MQKLQITDYKPFPFIVNAINLAFVISSKEEVVVESLVSFEKKNSSSDILKLNGSKYLSLESVYIDENQLSPDQYELTEDFLKIDVSDYGSQFTLKTIVALNPEDNKSLEGLYTSGDLLTTQCESEGFRAITFFPDRPDVLTVYTTSITAPKSAFPVMMSNGDLVDYYESEGTHTIKWNDPHKKPCYLFALVAGDLASIKETYTTISGKEVSLEVYAEEKDIDKCSFAMEALKRSIKWDEDHYGLELDLTSYKIVAIDDFNSGAMENKGLNIFNSKCILADPRITTDNAYKFVDAVIAHEYFHNYTGNRVTCRDWFQLTLKEGLTVFRDQQYSKTFETRDVKIIDDAAVMRSAQFAEDRSGSRHPIQPKKVGSIDNFYTVTVYDKGAEVIRMIETIVGEQPFNEGVRYYLKKFDGQAVTCQDFVAAIEESTGHDLSQFYRWYDQAGTPEVTISSEYNQTEKSLIIKMHQDYKSEYSSLYGPLHIPCRIAFFTKDGKKMTVEHKGKVADEFVLNLMDEYQAFEFIQVEDSPVISCFREFSAPVLWSTDASKESLAVIAKFDDDGFSKYNAVQHFMVESLVKAVSTGENVSSESVDEVVDLIKYGIDSYLNSGGVTEGMLSKIMSIPSLSYLTSSMKEYDIEVAKRVIDNFYVQLAGGLHKDLLDVYSLVRSRVNSGEFSYELAEMRGLMNRCLMFLTDLEIDLTFGQLKEPQNFTEEVAALSCVMNSDKVEGSLKQSVVQNFFNKWNDEKLALTTGISVICSADSEFALSKTKEILDMGIMDKKNPNFVRSTVGAFSSSIAFHNMDGSGYEFVLGQVAEIDKSNPALASRLLGAFEDVHKYNIERKDLVLGLLKDYKDKVESANCVEKINNIIDG